MNNTGGHSPDKDSYDEFLGFSRITADNWMRSDRKNYIPFGISPEAWPKPMLEPQLNPAVPRDVVRVFEIARAAVVYSWFFYPLATLGLEQCTRVAEFAAREKCRLLNRGSERLYDNLATLLAAGLITNEQEFRWQALRQLRNDRSHLNGFMLTDPGQAAGVLHTTAELINGLFPAEAPADAPRLNIT